ncbi:hypothetical protein, partial [Burkholderia sp. L27(2015)]|uniref:hypothetical protein n=1 Tax=Burkholderia sp. L27(2015) TaxID=1641858 RepID=UPI001C203396
MVVPAEALNAAIALGEVKTDVPFDIGLPRDISMLSPAAKGAFDRNIHLLGDLVAPRQTQKMLDPIVRRDLVARQAERVNVPYRKVLELLFRFWWAGQVEAGLIPAYDKRGGPGLQQAARAKNGEPAKRRGRKPRDERNRCDVDLPSVRDLLKSFAAKRVFDAKQSVPTAYNELLDEHFAESLKSEQGKV